MSIRFLPVFLLATLALGPASGRAQESGPGAENPVVETYRKAIQVDPQDVIAHFNLGLALYKLDRHVEAMQVLEKTIQLKPGDARAHAQVDGPANQLLGIIYYSQIKDDQRAVEAFQRSLKWLPKDTDTYYALGLAYARLKEPGKAVQAFGDALAAGRTKDPDLYFHLARTLAENKQDPEAIANYEKAVALKPNFPEALENLAMIYHRRQMGNQAQSTMEKLIKFDPANFNANYLLGLYYYQQKHYAEMEAAYNRAVAVKPDLPDAYYNLGMAYYYQTRFDQAVEALKKTVSLNPKDVEAYNLLGQAQLAAVENHLDRGSNCVAQEKYPEAVMEFSKVLTIDPENRKAKGLLEELNKKITEEVSSHLRQAESFYAQKRVDEAYTEYESALKFDPDSAQAKAGLEKAKVQLSRLLSQYSTRGKQAEKLKDYPEALWQYEAALKLKPNYAPARNARESLKKELELQIQRQWASGRKAAQENEWRSAAAHYKILLKLAEILKAEAWQQKALAALSQGNAQQADLVQNALAEGRKALQNGDTGKAQKLFGQALKLDPQNRAANDYIVKLTGAPSQTSVQADLIKSTYYKGVDCYVKGNIEEAIAQWKKVTELDPENQDARINIERARAKLAAIKKLTSGR